MSEEGVEYVKAHVGISFTSTLGSLIISVQNSSLSGVDFVIGRTGFPNVTRTEAKLGECVLFETPDDGIIEVRLYHLQYRDKPVFRVTKISPAPGITGGLLDEDIENRPFSQPEAAHVRRSIQSVKDTLLTRQDIVRPEQMEFINRKLDDLAAATDRMGRKDWINFAVGVLSNVIVGAALSPEAAKFLFQMTGSALSWLWGSTIHLLSGP